MERLTERDNNCGYGWDIRCRRCDILSRRRCLQCSERTRLYNRLADYEDAEEECRLAVFPVGIGDRVWCFLSAESKYREMAIVGLELDIGGAKFVHVLDILTRETVYFNVKHLGVSMFKTEEEAKAKLAELEEQNGKTDIPR